ncbi:WYL domain-containing protein [Vibrio parahaemolyticus]|uniref:WYL domain-containing protein n=1 Tax=Vibrio parahaemolyticus TaxID=670 RepID=UPI0038928EC1
MQWFILALAIFFVIGVINTFRQERQNSSEDIIPPTKAQSLKNVSRPRKRDLSPPTEAEIISKFSPDNGIDITAPEVEEEPQNIYERPNSELWNGARKVTIEYKDSKGTFTTRDVRMTSVFCNQNGELCMKGRCLLRDSTRTFKGDRIRVITTARGKEYPDFFEYITEELSV